MIKLRHRKRVIPVLLLHEEGVVKSKKFKNYTYVGDPINAVRVFNDKEVDELILLDIDASKNGRGPNFEMIADITGEAFMPIAYGGGITTLEQAEKLFYNGIEKLIINTSLYTESGLELVKTISMRYGSQSVVASLDIRESIFGKVHLYHHVSRKTSKLDFLEFAKSCEQAGVGEIMLNSMSRDGMYSGYDLVQLNKLAKSVSIPVIISGGASSTKDFAEAEANGASAMAAGSMFVFQRPHNAVLISYNV